MKMLPNHKLVKLYTDVPFFGVLLVDEFQREEPIVTDERIQWQGCSLPVVKLSEVGDCVFVTVVAPPDQAEHFVLTIRHCEPTLHGPYVNAGERLEAAQRLFHDHHEFRQGYDDIAWLDKSADGKMNVGCFTGDDLGENLPVPSGLENQ